MEPGVKMGEAPQTERMTLSQLRAHIRAGSYQDDRYAEGERHLLFLRWLVRRGQLNGWQVTAEVRQEEQSDICLSPNRGYSEKSSSSHPCTRSQERAPTRKKCDGRD